MYCVILLVSSSRPEMLTFVPTEDPMLFVNGSGINLTQTIILAMVTRPARIMVHRWVDPIRGHTVKILIPLTSHQTILSMAIAMLAILSFVMV